MPGSRERLRRGSRVSSSRQKREAGWRWSGTAIIKAESSGFIFLRCAYTHTYVRVSVTRGRLAPSLINIRSPADCNLRTPRTFQAAPWDFGETSLFFA